MNFYSPHQEEFRSLGEMVLSVAESIRPPERLLVSESAEKYRKVYNPGSYVGMWKNSVTPYLIEPQDVLTSEEYSGMVLAGPAQCGKTDIVFNFVTHTAKCDPADFMILQTSKSLARDFSRSKLDRFFEHCEAVGATILPGSQSRNTFDVKFKSGWILTLTWPTVKELSGKSIPRIWITDRDRIVDNLGSDGEVFDMALQRTKSFRRKGMVACESSPSRDLVDRKWKPSSPHEAPPVGGISSLYNRGDRRRYYWQCVNCKSTFEPHFKYLDWPDTEDIMEAAEATTMVCPHCEHAYTHDAGPGQPGKQELNQSAKWIKEGQIWLPDGTIEGTARRSKIASFWLYGVCAAFSTWGDLVFKTLSAKEEMRQTQSFEALKTTVNTDRGEVFIPPSSNADILPEDIQSRARDLGNKVVPDGVRFLIATIDVQKNKWVVQVMGIGVGMDIYIVDRFDIKYSNRYDEDEPTQRLRVNPATHLEDWNLLIDQVIEKTYPLADGSGRHMQIKMLGCDTGGRDGVTFTAYNFWRYLKFEHGAEHHKRFRLLRGDPRKTSPRVSTTYPDSERKDKKAGARGEIPVLAMNANKLKDMVSAMLERKDPFGGRINFADWLPLSFYNELVAEIKTSKGWENPKRRRNEAWDLIVYAVGLCLERQLKVDAMDWTDPPDWAQEWDSNVLVFDPDGPKPFEDEEDEFDFSALAEAAKKLA